MRSGSEHTARAYGCYSKLPYCPVLRRVYERYYAGFYGVLQQTVFVRATIFCLREVVVDVLFICQKNYSTYDDEKANDCYGRWLAIVDNYVLGCMFLHLPIELNPRISVK